MEEIKEFIPTYGHDSPGLFIHEYLTKAKVAPMYEIFIAYRAYRENIGKKPPSHYSFYQNYLWRLIRLNYLEKIDNIPSLATYNQTYVSVKNPTLRTKLFPYIDNKFEKISVYSLWRALLWKSGTYISIENYWDRFIEPIKEYLNIHPLPPTSPFDKVLVKIAEGCEERDKVWENVQKGYKMIVIKKDHDWIYRKD